MTNTIQQTSAKPTDPVIQLRIQRPNASRDDLEAEALELMEILRDCVLKTSELTGYLAGHPDVIAPYQKDISMLDATAGYLTTILSPSMSTSVRPTEEQALRRTEIRSQHYRAIKQMRRIPAEPKEVDESTQGGHGPALKAWAAYLASKADQEKIHMRGASGQGGTGLVPKKLAMRLAVNESRNDRKTDMRGANPIVHGTSGVLKFQLDGAGQEGSGSTEEKQDEREVDDSDQGGSRPCQGCQGDCMKEVD